MSGETVNFLFTMTRDGDWTVVEKTAYLTDANPACQTRSCAWFAIYFARCAGSSSLPQYLVRQYFIFSSLAISTGVSIVLRPRWSPKRAYQPE